MKNHYLKKLGNLEIIYNKLLNNIFKLVHNIMNHKKMQLDMLLIMHIQLV